LGAEPPCAEKDSVSRKKKKFRVPTTGGIGTNARSFPPGGGGKGNFLREQVQKRAHYFVAKREGEGVGRKGKVRSHFSAWLKNSGPTNQQDKQRGGQAETHPNLFEGNGLTGISV